MAILYGRKGCRAAFPLFRGREGCGSRGRHPSEGANLFKFILFFFTVKNPGHRSPPVRCRLFQPPSRWLSARFLGGRRPRQAPSLPGLSAVLQDVESQRVAECLYFGKSYHWILGKVTNGNLPLEHNTTLPFHIYSFALASIFLCGRTYLPILPHLICRLNGASERLSERHSEMRKRSESHTNFLYDLSLVRPFPCLVPDVSWWPMATRKGRGFLPTR